MHVCKIWDNDLTEYQVWYTLTELYKAFRHFLTPNRKQTFQIIFSYNSSRKRIKLWAIFLPRLKFLFEKSEHLEAGLKHTLKPWRLEIFRDPSKLVFVNENCCLCKCFTANYISFIDFSSLSCNFNHCAVCFQSFMNFACRSTQNAVRIKRFWRLLIDKSIK